MNVTIVLPGFAPNPIGGYKVAFEYANAMSRSGNTVRIIQAWDFEGDKRYSSITQRLRSMKQARAVIANQRPNWFALDERISIVNRLRGRFADTAGADVIVATAARTANFVVKSCDIHGAAGVYFIQHYEDWDLPQEELADTWKLPLKKVVIAPWLSDVGETIGVPTVLVPNAINAEEFPAGLPISQRPLRVSAMLSPMPFKRADLVCAMFSRVLDVVPGASGVAFGVDVRPDELDSRVEYIQRPNRDQLRNIYQTARVYVCASDAEGWHLPPAEAMSSGAAVVSTDIGGVKAYADGSALFTPRGDANALTDSVIQLLADETLNSVLAERGNAAMVSYTPTMAADAFESELRKAR